MTQWEKLEDAKTYLGGTPKIGSRVGKQVLQDAYDNGTLRISGLSPKMQSMIENQGFNEYKNYESMNR